MNSLAVVAVVAAALVACAHAETIRPVVLWHGMGDTCCNPFSMGSVKREIEKVLPGVYVHSIMLGSNAEEDQMDGFFGNVNDQLASVAAQLQADPNLKDGFNALGFSQGGQFLRAFVERYNDPPVYNLVTFGGQHMGVSEIPHCMGTNTTLCELMAKLLSAGVYLPGVRDYSVQAQYFRSPYNYDKYLEYNIFLADINNERAQKNQTYKRNLLNLNNFVLIKFMNDTMVIPRDSEFFGAFAEGAESEVIPVWQQPIYTEDWIGLQGLNATSRLVFLECPGQHLQFTMQYFQEEVIVPYLNNTLPALVY